jgi:hypothetical protein
MIAVLLPIPSGRRAITCSGSGNLRGENNPNGKRAEIPPIHSASLSPVFSLNSRLPRIGRQRESLLGFLVLFDARSNPRGLPRNHKSFFRRRLNPLAS